MLEADDLRKAASEFPQVNSAQQDRGDPGPSNSEMRDRQHHLTQPTFLYSEVGVHSNHNISNDHKDEWTNGRMTNYLD